MNRRDLLKRIIGAAPLAIVPAAAALTISSQSQTGDSFHGWHLYWTGWKPMAQQDVLCGQWIAYSHEPGSWQLYSSWPGAVSPCQPGYVFNLAQRKDQVMPTARTPEADLRWMRNECLERLKRMIVKVGPPPFDPYKSEVVFG